MSTVHRDTFSSCPRCASGLDETSTQLSCGHCHGTLIPERELIDSVSRAQARALLAPESRWNKRDQVRFVHDVGPAVEVPDPVACPRCATTMTRHALFGVPIDRCPAHGLWLDGVTGVQTILAGALAGL